MNQYNQKNKTNGTRTGPEFEKEMDIYVPVGAILVELKDCSDKADGGGIESKILGHDLINSENSANIERLISSILGNGRRD
jgi:hypothetical protein